MDKFAVNFDSAVPWGWSPTVIDKFSAINISSDRNWKPEYESWYRRETALSLLEYILNRHPELSFPQAQYPLVCSSVDEVSGYMEKWQKMVVKLHVTDMGKNNGVTSQNIESHNSSLGRAFEPQIPSR